MTASTSSPTSSAQSLAPSLRIKIIVVAIGLSLGLAAAFVLALFLWRPDGRSSFASLSDLRASMSERGAQDVDAEGSVSLRSIVEPHPADDIIYVLRPNLEVKFQKVRVVTNSHGMRGPEVAIAKEPGTYRIAFLGDSFTFGWGVEEPQIFVRVLEQLLNERFAGKPRVEVLNFGVPGYSTFQEKALYREKVAAFKPDMVVVYFVDNDFGLPFLVGSGEGKLTGVVGWVRDIYGGGSAEERAKLRELEQRADANKALLALDAELGRQRIPLFLALNPGKGNKSVRNKLWALRKPHNFKVIGMAREMDEIIRERGIVKKDLSLPTDPHPSGLKHRLLGEILASHLGAEIPS